MRFKTWVCGLGVLVLLAAAPGCGNGGRHSKEGFVPLDISVETVNLRPGAEGTVKIVSGKAKGATAPKNSGLTVRSEGDKVVIAAPKTARPGKYTVAIAGNDGQKESVTVNVLRPAAK